MPLAAIVMNGRMIAAFCLATTCLQQPVIAAPLALAIRATGPQATATLTTFIARNAEPTRLGRSLAGVLQERTPRQVISSLCGSVRRDYYREFVQANQAVIR